MAWNAPLDDAIAIWSAAEYPGSGSVIPESLGSGRDATIVGATFSSGSPDFFTLNGTSDLLRISDHADFDLDNAKTLTFLMSCQVVTGIANGKPIMCKDADISNTASPGWGIRYVPSSDGRVNTSDGSSLGLDQAAITKDSRIVIGGIWENDLDHGYELVADGTLTGSPDGTALGDCSNAENLTIGSDGNESNFAPLIFYGCAIWDRALTQSEIDAFEAALDAGDITASVSIRYWDNVKLVRQAVSRASLW